jgi:Skp family chaperone for outer membrane proteins
LLALPATELNWSSRQDFSMVWRLFFFRSETRMFVMDRCKSFVGVRSMAPLVYGLSLAFAAGCSWGGDDKPQATGGVAVVDLDEIARQVGASAEMSQAIQAHEASLSTQLQTLKSSYVQQLQTKKEELGSEPTAEDKQRFAALSKQANINLVSAQQQAKGHLAKHRADLVVEFRQRVAPVAKQIAAERGLSLVIPRNEGMILAVDDQIDITSAVATALKPQWRTLTTPSSGTTVPTQPTPQMAGDSANSQVQPATHHEPATRQ